MENFSLIQLGVIGGIILCSLTIVGGILFLTLREKGFIQNYFDADFFVGFMLSASAFGLILPAFNAAENTFSYLQISLSIITGVVLLIFFDYVLKAVLKIEKGDHRKSVAFFLAMSLHNLPEGLAAGASLSHAQSAHTFSILSALGIQNVPEGFTTGASLLTLGISPVYAFFGVFLTGLVELFGGFLGGLLNTIVENQYPTILAFAGGAMMKVAIHELFEKIMNTDLNKVFNRNFILGFFVMTLLSI